VNSDFAVQFGGGDGAFGDFVTDNITIGGLTTPGFRFGVEYTGTLGNAIIGVGPRQGNPVEGSYPAALVAQGVTQAAAFGLWLNDKRSHNGQISLEG
jgi:hypothetical protein